MDSYALQHPDSSLRRHTLIMVPSERFRDHPTTCAVGGAAVLGPHVRAAQGEHVALALRACGAAPPHPLVGYGLMWVDFGFWEWVCDKVLGLGLGIGSGIGFHPAARIEIRV